MRIGLLGMGTIGSGVYEIVAKRAAMEIARVLDLRPIPGLGGKDGDAAAEDAAESAEPEERRCPFCREPIAEDATRCPHCTSKLEGYSGE